MEIKKAIEQLKREDLVKFVEDHTGQKAFKAGTNCYRFKKCPICCGGDHFNINPKNNLWNTFNNCGAGSIIDFYMEYYKYSKGQAIIDLCENFNLDIPKINPDKNNVINDFKDETKTTNKKELDKRDKPSSLNLTYLIDQLYQKNDDFSYFAKRLLNDYRYVVNKGFEENYDKLVSTNKFLTVKKGDLPKEMLPGPFNYANEFVVIPVWENNKVVNLILKEEGKQSFNLKGIAVKLFNIDYLKTNCKQIFITEGIFDCLSLEMLGYKAISINSANMYQRFLDAVKKNISTCKNTTFVIAFDNDIKGIEYTEKLKNGLKELGIKTINLNFPKEYKDINDIYLDDLQALRDSIEKSINPFKGIDEEVFYNNIEAYINYERLNTGFTPLDDNLRGVLPGLYVVGADTGLGKTTFCLQVADNIASTGKKVLYYSLEMSKFELQCKSLSRIAFKDLDEKVSVRDIFFNRDNETTGNSLEIYKKHAKNIEIIEGDFNLKVDNIKASIQNFINNMDGEKPIIFIDYLQVIEPKDFKMTDKASMDFNIKALKKLSRELFIPIFLISSLNRQSYNSDLENTAFKESGSIEYTADVMLGLQGKIVDELKNYQGNTKTHIDARKEIWQRYKEESAQTGIIKTKLKCLKNRFGKKDFDVEFDFHPKYNVFQLKEENKKENEVIHFPVNKDVF